MEHESTTTIPVPPDRLYEALSEVGNLSHLIPPLTSIEPTDSDHVKVEADYEGRHEHGEAWLRVDEDARRIEWGSETSPYNGWMQVEADGEGSKLTLHLTTPHAMGIEDYIVSTFESIRRHF